MGIRQVTVGGPGRSGGGRLLDVLMVEDSPTDAALVTRVLRTSGYAVAPRVVSDRAALSAALDRRPDVVLCDYNVPGTSPEEIIDLVRSRYPDLPVIVVTGTVDEEAAMVLFRRGASDLLLKDRLARLGPAVEGALVAQELALRSRQETERAEATRRLLATVVDHAPAAICVWGEDGARLVENERHRALVAAGLSARPPGTVPDGVPRETRVAGGTHLAVDFSVAGDGAARGAVGTVLMDITRQKQAEAALEAARAAREQQALELLAHNAELRRMDRLRTDLVATVSHELRTPLTSILGYTEMLAEDVGADPGADREMVGVISRNSRRLLELIDNLLLLARDDGTPAQRFGPRPVDPAELVSGVAAVFLPAARAAGVELDVQVAAGLPAVPGDRDELERMLFNLVSNALKFSPDGGRVELLAEAVRGGVRIVVTDHGIGMPPEDLERLGTRFFRGDTARDRQVQGTGLGFAVVRSIVERHGGELSLESQVGLGTTVRVQLPVTGTSATR